MGCAISTHDCKDVKTWIKTSRGWNHEKFQETLLIDKRKTHSAIVGEVVRTECQDGTAANKTDQLCSSCSKLNIPTDVTFSYTSTPYKNIMVYDWKAHKDIITRLYTEENLQVDEIIEYLRVNYNFAPRYVRPFCTFTPTLATATRPGLLRRVLSPAVEPPPLPGQLRARPRGARGCGPGCPDLCFHPADRNIK